MSIRHLERLFRPQSVAVFGASERAGSVGAAVLANLLQAPFRGEIFPVNPRYREVLGVVCHSDVAALPATPDLAVVCTPAATVPGIVEALGRRGTRAAVVISAGFQEAGRRLGSDLLQALLLTARVHGVRLLGPNSLGVLVPALGLNASFAPASARSGNLAFVSQSGALATTVLDWAAERQIGFSHFVSLGDGADVDAGDLIDYLGSDPETRAILLYLEALRDARKFMSATRAAARNKPVIVIKAGRKPEGARAAASHTGALAGSDAVYDAAIRRAGALRVYRIEDLFSTVEALGRARPMLGTRLAILTNGGGPGILATDALVELGGTLADLSPATSAALDRILPAHWSRGNPVDIIGDASPERYRAALQALLGDPAIDAVLLVHAPTAIAEGAAVASAVAPAAAASRKPVLGCWLGGATARRAAGAFHAAGLPTFSTPEEAVAAFVRREEYRRNQAALLETPARSPVETGRDAEAVRRVLTAAASEGRRWLSEVESKRILAAYGIPVVPARHAHTAEEAARAAAEIGFPVVLKVLSPDITHKSDVGGVVLSLRNDDAVRRAAEGIAARVRERGARLDGFSVQAMAARAHPHELILGASSDPLFGPVVLFGQGGTAVELLDDSAIALPPLNMSLARQLVERTRVAQLLAGYRERPAARIDLLCDALLRVASLITDSAQIESLDINPLWADEQGVLALDARIELRGAELGPRPPPAILPYPEHLEETVTFDGRTLWLRPIRPEDEPAHRELFSSLAGGDVRFRFFGLIKALEHSELARYTQIDYDREMAFIAVEGRGAGARTLGVARAINGPDRTVAEFAIVVRSDAQGRGLGRLLLEKLIRYCRSRGIGSLVGQVLADNRRMLALGRELGFTVAPAHDGVHEIRLALGPTD